MVSGLFRFVWPFAAKKRQAICGGEALSFLLGARV